MQPVCTHRQEKGPRNAVRHRGERLPCWTRQQEAKTETNRAAARAQAQAGEEPQVTKPITAPMAVFAEVETLTLGCLWTCRGGGEALNR